MAEYELYHYGVKGMKWGVRRARKYTNKARIARESAKEWDEIGRTKADKYRAAGKTKKADRVMSKYQSRADQDRRDADRYDTKAKRQETKGKFAKARQDVRKSRSTGAKVATFMLGGPFANKTYNSVIAAGGGKTAARVVTALASASGPLGHLAISAIYSNMAADGTTIKRYDK